MLYVVFYSLSCESCRMMDFISGGDLGQLSCQLWGKKKKTLEWTNISSLNSAS